MPQRRCRRVNREGPVEPAYARHRLVPAHHILPKVRVTDARSKAFPPSIGLLDGTSKRTATLSVLYVSLNASREMPASLPIGGGPGHPHGCAGTMS